MPEISSSQIRLPEADFLGEWFSLSVLYDTSKAREWTHPIERSISADRATLELRGSGEARWRVYGRVEVGRFWVEEDSVHLRLGDRREQLRRIAGKLVWVERHDTLGVSIVWTLAKFRR